jgi:hypothetical protein
VSNQKAIQTRSTKSCNEAAIAWLALFALERQKHFSHWRFPILASGLNTIAKWSTIPVYFFVWIYCVSYGLTIGLLPIAALVSTLYTSMHIWQIRQNNRCLLLADLHSKGPVVALMVSLLASSVGPKIGLFSGDNASQLMIGFGSAMVLGHPLAFLTALSANAIGRIEVSPRKP